VFFVARKFLHLLWANVTVGTEQKSSTEPGGGGSGFAAFICQIVELFLQVHFVLF
jgi:hypothetical protein